MRLTKEFLKEIDAMNSVCVIQVSENIYSLAQHRGNTFFEFFDIFFTDFDMNLSLKLDLNNIDVLFTMSCASNKLKNFFVKKESSIVPNVRPMQTVYLDPFHYMMQGLHENRDIDPCVSLIELTNILKDTTTYKVIIECLDEVRDLEKIYNHNSLGMVGSARKIQEILVQYVDTGTLWSRAKELFFPNVEPYKKGKPIIRLAKELA